MNWTQQLGLKFPILQAPMAGAQGVAMAAAVSNAGGLGAIPSALLSSDALDDALREFRRATSNASSAAVNLNFFTHVNPPDDAAAQARWRKGLAAYYTEFGVTPPTAAGAGRNPFDAACCEVLEHHQPEVVSFHFGLPETALLKRVKAWGAIVLSSATTVEEAVWLEAHGADVIIAQGLEAGGHRGMFLTQDITTQIGTLALLPQVIDAVSVPVIAAGGICSPRAVSAAIALGASAVQCGTAFLCCPESLINDLHRDKLTSEQARHTALTNLHTGRPARGIVNRLMRELGPMSALPPAFPQAAGALAGLRSAAEASGRSDFTPLWAGQDTSGCRPVPAAEQLQWLAEALPSS
ncbi:NAD(P)H-dependent flavin oxidoreductase [Halomonas halocynthiae]|uniref:NAD(P)H-dependent flavin oxidoreductase n=1 Tax=Halomonas halocynthiae TaxID=176290 RepID=UPI0004178A4A|nr:nitronate monooxygenase [Halomonas halocynthiae]